MKLITFLSLLTIIVLSCKEMANESEEIKIVGREDWVKNKGLTNVESVVYDSITKTFYVSCGKNYQPGTEGFITSVSAAGELLKLKWIDSLSRPTGMAIYKRMLFVADIDHLVVIDIDQAKILKKYQEPIENSGINDVAISPSGDIYVSASAKSAVYKLEADILRPWVADEEQLKWANGIEVSNDKLIVGGETLSSIDMKTGKIAQVPHPAALRDIEGIVNDGQGGYYITTVNNSALWHLNQQGEAKILLQDADYMGDLEVVLPDRLVVPRGNHETGEYYICLLELIVGN